MPSVLRAEDPWEVLRAMYPGVRQQSLAGQRAYVYGVNMTAATTTEAAARAFLEQHGQVFGAGEPQFEELSRTRTARGRSEVFAFRQKIRGKEVEGSVVRVVVRTEPSPAVVFAGVRLASEPTLGAEEPVVTGPMAALLALATPGCGPMELADEPTLVVLRGQRERRDAWCWRIRTRSVRDTFEERSFYVNTAVPELIDVHEHFASAGPPQTTVEVYGMGTPLVDPVNARPMPFRPGITTLVEQTIPGARVSAEVPGDEDEGFTDEDGLIVFEIGQPNDLIAIASALGPDAAQAGEWFRVIDEYGELDPPGNEQALSADTSGTTGAFIPLGFPATNDTSYPIDAKVAQIDLLASAYRSRVLFAEYISPTHTHFGEVITFRVNRHPMGGIQCNAFALLGTSPGLMFGSSWYSPPPPGMPQSPYCHNTASHSLVPHEYGHLVHRSFGFTTGGEFSEGYADCFAVMVNNDHVQARSQYADGSHFRDDPTLDTINCQYPIDDPNQPNPGQCSCDSGHKAGQLLSGVWVDILKGMKAEFGDEEGLEITRSLFGYWTTLMTGADGHCNAAHCGTLAEVLHAHEDLGLGDPDIITEAFELHGISASICE